MAHMQTITEVALDDYDEVLKVNLRGSFVVAKQALVQMEKANRGRILLFASIAGKEGNAGMCCYSSTKAGVIGLVKSIGKEFAESGITVNAILPGPVRTSFYERVTSTMSNEEQDTFFNKGLGPKVPMQRPGAPEDIAGAALFLASELGAYVTCQTLCVAGGLPQLP